MLTLNRRSCKRRGVGSSVFARCSPPQPRSPWCWHWRPGADGAIAMRSCTLRLPWWPPSFPRPRGGALLGGCVILRAFSARGASWGDRVWRHGRHRQVAWSADFLDIRRSPDVLRHDPAAFYQGGRVLACGLAAPGRGLRGTRDRVYLRFCNIIGRVRQRESVGCSDGTAGLVSDR